MSSKWQKRKTRLRELLNSLEDNDEEGLALDRILHGQSVIGKTSKTVEIEKLRFTDLDLDELGTLDRGQFGVIHVVSCKLDGRVYARKSLEKRFVLRNRDQCFPQLERDLLLRAYKTDSNWAPHLLCAFQTSTHLNLVMDFAEGGTLWDLLESSPLDGRISESDITWWAPQIVSAINWCHEQRFVHRDIKPHNFVLTEHSHVLLIDFGSAAPLLPAQSDGSRLVLKRHCFVPCGTCDYISPEILQAHEEALVALEMSSSSSNPDHDVVGGYGVEVDWWSFGAMLYELVYGVAPFFANDIKQTYFKITNHQKHLSFDPKAPVSTKLRGLLQRFLTAAEDRLGRRGFTEIKSHAFFSNINWSSIRERPKPSGLHLPQFSYDIPIAGKKEKDDLSLHPSLEESDSSRPFAFSAFLQSSQPSSIGGSSLHITPASKFGRSANSNQVSSSFIGFSWGPVFDAFTEQEAQRTILVQSPFSPVRNIPISGVDSRSPLHPFATPVRLNLLTPHPTIPRSSSIRRTSSRRPMSDREAMKQLVDLVGMSARKKIVESGRKPRILTMSFPNNRNRSGTVKELRFNTSPVIIDRRYSSVDSSRFDSTMLKPLQFTSMSSVDNEAVTDTETDTEIPPSPSPSPRPGSAMSILSRRSQTPTITGSLGIPGRARLASVDRTEMTSIAPSFIEPNPEDTLSDVVFDDLDKRHAKLLEDITGIHMRLHQLSSQVP